MGTKFIKRNSLCIKSSFLVYTFDLFIYEIPFVSANVNTQNRTV